MEYMLMLRTAHALGPDVRDNHAASASAARDSWQALGAAAAIIIFGQLATTFCESWLPSAVHGGAYKPNSSLYVKGQIEQGR